MTYECILVETLGDGPRKTGLIRLNRPKALNALSDPLMDELGEALYAFDADDGIGCIVITGSEKAFAAGADIPTLAQHDFMSAFNSGLISKNWEHILRIRKPVLGAVSGFCLGGGCELAMMCDVLYAADTAKFGQPEIKLGVIPGGGGTQRLPRWVGKSKAMDMLLTGRFMDAAEAERAGLVARVVPAADLMKETLAAAETINGYAAPVVALMKQLCNQSFEVPLTEGVKIERGMFHAVFGTPNQKEGMAAFLEKRPPTWRND
ncbi:MAG: enoyl-CoA hydratase-related protein [Burkholderiales bacterium]|jgi:enoyl-CoA hydratase